MTLLIQRYATPFITGLFLISLISGVALYFHVGQSTFHQMHEVLSMVLILPFALHLWRNWRSFLNYFRRAPMVIALVVSLVSALFYAWPQSVSGTGGAGGGGPPQFAFAEAVMANSPAEVATLFGRTADTFVSQLSASGFTIDSADEALSDIATRSGKTTADVIRVLMQPAG